MIAEGTWLVLLLVSLFLCLPLLIMLALRLSTDKMKNKKINVGDIVKWKHSFREGEWLGGLVVDIDPNTVCYTVQPFHSANSRITLLADTYGDYWYKVNKEVFK